MGAEESERVRPVNLEKVDHIVVMMLENRSFDHMLGYSLSLAGARISTACAPDSPTNTRGTAIRFTTSVPPPSTWTLITPRARSTSRSPTAAWAASP